VGVARRGSGTFAGVTPENSKAAGWMKFSPETTGRGQVSFEFVNGGIDWASTLTKIGTINEVWFEGVYSFDALKIEAKFDKSAYVDGTMFLNAEKYVFKGKFGASIASFKLIGYSNGSDLGVLTIQWAPTVDHVAALRAGKVEPADQLLVYMKLKRKQAPNEYRALLKRTGSIR